MLRPTLTAPATLVAALALVVAGQSPVQAQELVVEDDAGDAVGRGMDITDVAFANRDSAFVVEVTFVEDRPSDVIVFVRERAPRAAKVSIISRHRASGPDDVDLYGEDGPQPCQGLRSESDRAAATMRLRLPSRCLDGGDYGALRSWVLIEPRGGGGDSDWAPERPNGDITLTDPIPRG